MNTMLRQGFKRLYKRQKTWVAAGLATTVVALGLGIGLPGQAQADTVTTSAASTDEAMVTSAASPTAPMVAGSAHQGTTTAATSAASASMTPTSASTAPVDSASAASSATPTTSAALTASAVTATPAVASAASTTPVVPAAPASAATTAAQTFATFPALTIVNGLRQIPSGYETGYVRWVDSNDRDLMYYAPVEGYSGVGTVIMYNPLHPQTQNGLWDPSMAPLDPSINQADLYSETPPLLYFFLGYTPHQVQIVRSDGTIFDTLPMIITEYEKNKYYTYHFNDYSHNPIPSDATFKVEYNIDTLSNGTAVIPTNIGQQTVSGLTGPMFTTIDITNSLQIPQNMHTTNRVLAQFRTGYTDSTLLHIAPYIAVKVLDANGNPVNEVTFEPNIIQGTVTVDSNRGPVAIPVTVTGNGTATVTVPPVAGYTADPATIDVSALADGTLTTATKMITYSPIQQSGTITVPTNLGSQTLPVSGKTGEVVDVTKELTIPAGMRTTDRVTAQVNATTITFTITTVDGRSATQVTFVRDGGNPTNPTDSGTAPTSPIPTAPKPAVPVTPAPSRPAVFKGSAVLATKAIYLYTNPTFSRRQRIVLYRQQPRAKRPMFVVIGTARSSHGRLRYKVRDVNHRSKTAGKVGYVTANAGFVTPAYYATKSKTITVIGAHGVNAYQMKALTGKVKHLRRGTKLHVRGLVHYHLTTRFILSNGTYVTANKTLVMK